MKNILVYNGLKTEGFLCLVVCVLKNALWVGNSLLLVRKHNCSLLSGFFKSVC